MYQENLESIEYASDEELSKLKGTLKELRRNVTQFNQAYTTEFETLLTKENTESIT